MNRVEPIRDKNKIEEMKNKLLKNSYRDYVLFIIGINTGLKISDILDLKVSDVKEKNYITITEGKDNRKKKFLVNPHLQEEIDKYIVNMKDWEYLFQSQKGHNKPISRVQAYRILKKSAEELGIYNVGTHTLRKTFGYHHYRQNKELSFLQKLFNHASPAITLDYIGVDEEIIDESADEFYL